MSRRLMGALIVSTLGACSASPPGGAGTPPLDVRGRGDGWNFENDPDKFGGVIFKKLADLPTAGTTREKPWSADYFATAHDSINHRWNGDGTHTDSYSPAQKYDFVFNGWQPPADFHSLRPWTEGGDDCATRYDARYYDEAGIFSQFIHHEKGFYKVRNGVDDDGDGKIDECDDRDGIEGWWGICHSWAPSAIAEVAPKWPVVKDGVAFYPGDLHALLIIGHDMARPSSVMVGDRCYDGHGVAGRPGEKVEFDERGRPTNTGCMDINAGSFHILAANMLGLRREGFVEDRTFDSQVWNQPVYRFEVTHMQDIDIARAHRHLAVDGAHEFGGAGNADIPDNNPDGVVLAAEVPTSQVLTETFVHMRLRHTRSNDLRIFLAHENGAEIEIFANQYVVPEPGDTSADLPGELTDAEAEVPQYINLDLPVPGFNQTDAKGVWKLRVIDESAGNAGSVIDWSLRVKARDTDVYAYNPDARRLVEVAATVEYGAEVRPGKRVGQPSLSTDHYTYILELNDAGEIIGGEWYGASKREHPDFFWTANAVGPAFALATQDGQPVFDMDAVRAMVADSRRPRLEATAPAQVQFRYDTGLAETTATVNRDFTVDEVQLDLDILFEDLGNLQLFLVHGDREEEVFFGAPDQGNRLNRTLAVSGFGGMAASGAWTLRVGHSGEWATGTIANFTVRLRATDDSVLADLNESPSSTDAP